MVQLLALNYIIQNKDADLLLNYNSDFYFNYLGEYLVIKKYYEEHKEIPDVSYVEETMPQFTIIANFQESKEMIERKLYEEYVYETTRRIFHTDKVKQIEDFIRQLDLIIVDLQRSRNNATFENYSFFDDQLKKVTELRMYYVKQISDYILNLIEHQEEERIKTSAADRYKQLIDALQKPKD